MPLPNTRVIPDGWAAAHETPVAGTRTATIALREPGTTSSWDEASQSTVTTPFPEYATVSCRVQALTNDAQTIDAAEQTVTVTAYLVVVPASVTGVKVGHIGTVTASGDPDLDGREVKVEAVVLGSLRFERDLFCSLS